MVSQLRGNPALAQFLLSYLDKAIEQNTFVEIDEAYPYKRAFADGRAQQAAHMETLLKGILNGGDPR